MGTTLVGGHDQTLHLDVIRIPVFQPFAWLRAGWLDMRPAGQSRLWGVDRGGGLDDSGVLRDAPVLHRRGNFRVLARRPPDVGRPL